MREAVRVALLARPGAGADRLREALVAAGASLVLDADPATVDPEALSGAGVQSVVVLLEAAVEEALERLDPVLHAPGIDVLYEEAAVAAAREGWDVARWTRHLSAKLLRHGDVLPPRQGAPVEPPHAATEDARLDVSVDVPVDAPVDATPDASPGGLVFDPVLAEYDDAADATAAPAPIHAPEPAPGTGIEPVLATDPADAADPDVQADAAEADADEGSDALRGFRRNLAEIERRIASMELVDDGPAAQASESGPGPLAASDPEPSSEPRTDPEPDADQASAPAPAVSPVFAVAESGAVVVFAGIGGPDAVRQFLGELPQGFPRPVLIHQQLDGGHHDRLVQQMSRATRLPVVLAADGAPAEAGRVYVVPPGIGLAPDPAGLRFAAGADTIANLPPAASAVLMFSGSDIALVDPALAHAVAGALVAGQDPEGCYDAAATHALLARGGEAAQPADLARRLADRWAA